MKTSSVELFIISDGATHSTECSPIRVVITLVIN